MSLPHPKDAFDLPPLTSKRKNHPFFMQRQGLLGRTSAETARACALYDQLDQLLIENGGIARDVYPCRGCFASSDVEVLVDRFGRDPRCHDLPDHSHLMKEELPERKTRQPRIEPKLNIDDHELHQHHFQGQPDGSQLEFQKKLNY